VTIAPSPRAALVAYLAADADVVSLAGARVYGAELPGDDTTAMPQYAVVVQNAGGNGKANYSTQYNARFDIVAYGATPAAADQLLASGRWRNSTGRSSVGQFFTRR
jgi:hypothetical protein